MQKIRPGGDVGERGAASAIPRNETDVSGSPFSAEMHGCESMRIFSNLPPQPNLTRFEKKKKKKNWVIRDGGRKSYLLVIQ